MVSCTFPASKSEPFGPIDHSIRPGSPDWNAYAATAGAQAAARTPAVTSLRQVKGTRPGTTLLVLPILLIPQRMDGIGARNLHRVPDDRGNCDSKRDQSRDDERNGRQRNALVEGV